MSGIPGALSGALGILQGVARFFTDPGHVLQDAVAWAGNALFPPELQTWFLGTIGAPGSQWDSTQVFQNLYHAVQPPALLLAGGAAAARMLRGSVDARVAPSHALFDVLPRFILVVLIIGIPTTTVSFGYDMVVFAVNASMLVARALFQLIVHASLLQGTQPGEGWFSHLYHVIANAGHSLVAVVVGGIPLLILVLYAVFLMVVRTIMIGFCIATAPLCLATFAFDSHNRFVRYWADLLLGALLTPIVFALAISLSVAMASSVVSAAVVGPLLAFAVMAGGLWFAAKLIHHITWRHFSHGGAVAGFAAGVSTMLAPVHHAATAGFLMDAVGATRATSGGALGFVKRLGAAAHGSPHGIAGFNEMRGSGTLVGTGQPADSADDGTAPDITSMLSPAGRAAVGTASTLFSRSAFQRFATEGTRLIGQVTADVPFGAVSQSERARLAWDRFPERDQRSFADEHLALWLASAES